MLSTRENAAKNGYVGIQRKKVLLFVLHPIIFLLPRILHINKRDGLCTGISGLLGGTRYCSVLLLLLGFAFFSVLILVFGERRGVGDLRVGHLDVEL